MRAASSYRAARRNEAKAARQLPAWRSQVADAGICARAVVANGAREAAAAALVNNRVGLPEVTMAAAYLGYYRAQQRTRPVNRIIRELQKQVRSAGVRT